MSAKKRHCPEPAAVSVTRSRMKNILLFSILIFSTLATAALPGTTANESNGQKAVKLSRQLALKLEQTGVSVDPQSLPALNELAQNLLEWSKTANQYAEAQPTTPVH